MEQVGLRDNWRVYLFGALGGLLFGYDTGVISGAILYITPEFGLTPFLEGAVVAGLLLGAMVGAAVAGRLSDRLGRRMLILIAAVIFTVGALGAALAPSAGVLIAFRILLGVAVGAAALIVPLYLSEVAPTEIRGKVTGLNQMAIVSGIQLAFLVNAVLAPSENWRLMVGLAVVPSTVLFFGMLRMPETPRWLVSVGQDDVARRVLGETRPEAQVTAEMEQIRTVEEEESGHGLREVFAPWVRPALIVAIGLAVFQQAIGINTIIYFAPTTLTEVGYSDTSAIYANIIIGVMNVVATVIAIRKVDDLGRKPLLLGGLVGMVGSLVVLGLSNLLMASPDAPGDPLAIITLACLATFIVSFAASWGVVVWVILPEILPLNVRGTAMGVAIFLHWGANFAVSQTFPTLLDSFGAGPVFLGYGVVGVLAFIFTGRYVTETKGRSLEDIEADLHARSGGPRPGTRTRPA